ncbi:uncharacterized protein NECHADRAFT_98822 [Fusarium vanettenii 77-13-4]|uniref:Uncharacterized protein n=1 Tax=Fusarium vanettenii (strain ATCC MYA-4622 / CBS 123669 / FGSC 9596 / NRRL 45880 / 77-13-4) TaxID=660122 RepID=C7YHA9_FUSV7|nr:uncharacterized protein NECHADRAFT_98822 [Fusarium vanettenii 77-13-4]EEU47887.1 hypothetical protein NECHADRAFT_98822 [Fusarium vanettenii 77-13-4]
MRFTSVFVAGAFAVMASAQSATVSVSPAQQSQLDCLDACDAGDFYTLVHNKPLTLFKVPSPNEKQVNATNECVANCPKGKGSEADTQKYAACLEQCVSDNYWKTVDGTPRETAASGSSNDEDSSSKAAGSKATATGTDATAAASASASGSGSEDSASETASDSEASGTASGTAASSTETGNAAPALVGGVSLLGLFAAVLAL